MDGLEIYDVIILGTSLKECVLACLFCQAGKKVLILDRERFSGGVNGSIADREDLQERFDAEIPHKSGEWNVDLIPKLFLAKTKMMTLLQKLGITVDTKPIHKVYVLQNSNLLTVPNSVPQVNTSNLLTESDKSIYKDIMKLSNQSNISKIIKNYPNTQLLLESKGLGLQGRKLLMHGMSQNCTGKSTENFLEILHRFCDLPHHQSSSLLYPLYGFGEVIKTLIKKVTTNGGRCMLNKPIYNVKDSEGNIEIDARGGLRAMSQFLIGDSSYFKVEKEQRGRIVRALCIFDKCYIPGNESKLKSCFVTVPGEEFNKTHDAHVLVLGTEHLISPEGLYIAHASTIVESDNAEAEIEGIIKIIGNVKAFSASVTSVFVNDNSKKKKVFITSAYDSSMSLDPTFEDVVKIYENVTCQKLDL